MISKQTSPDDILRLKGAQKGLSNELKRSIGKVEMMQKLKLVDERMAEEEDLISKAGEEAKEVLDRLTEIYDELTRMSPLSRTLTAAQGWAGGSGVLTAGHFLNEFVNYEAKKPDEHRESRYRNRNLEMHTKQIANKLNNFVLGYDSEDISDLLQLASEFEELAEFAGIIGSDINSAVVSSHQVLKNNLELVMAGDADAMEIVKKDR